MIEKLPDREATVDGSKRRELAVRPRATTTAFWPAPTAHSGWGPSGWPQVLRENIQVVVDDVARSSVGNTAQEVSSKYQLQLVHVYTLIEQVDPAPQIKSELTEIFTVRPLKKNCRLWP